MTDSLKEARDWLDQFGRMADGNGSRCARIMRDLLSIAEPSAGRLEYLEKYHHITQHLIGVAKLIMTPEQRQHITGYERELDVLRCNRLLSFGVEITGFEITDDDLIRMFNISADVVAECRAAKEPA